MKKILFYIAALCIFTQALGADRRLDSTLFVDKHGLRVIDGSAPLTFKCGREWSIAFTHNGGTATLRTQSGHWTLTGLTSEIALAAVSEGAPLIAGVAGTIGVNPTDIQSITTKTLAIAGAIAKTIGSPLFDTALVGAVAGVNDILDDQGIHPADFNDEILLAVRLLGPSGAVIDASDTTVEEIHRDAKKTIGTILNALASTGASRN